MTLHAVTLQAAARVLSAGFNTQASKARDMHRKAVAISCYRIHCLAGACSRYLGTKNPGGRAGCHDGVLVPL